MKKINYIFDFDSTLTRSEALEDLGEISLGKMKNKDETLAKIKHLTDLGIDGKIDFSESLEKRLTLLKATKQDIETLVRKLQKKVSPSFKRNKVFFKSYKSNIYVISAGFKEFIVPIMKAFQIDKERVFANTFVYDKDGIIVGFDKKNPLSESNGKIKQIQALNLEGEIHVIGDGYSDYMMKASGMAHKFYAFTENVERNSAVEVADHITPSFDEYLYVNNLPRSQSFPKHRLEVAIFKNAPKKLLNKFEKEGFGIRIFDNTNLESEENINIFKNVFVIIIDNQDFIPNHIIKSAKKLMCIASFSHSSDNLNLKLLSKMGIAAFNAKQSNTRGIAELVIGEAIVLSRNIVNKSRQLHAGKWDSSISESSEVRGKTIGIIGYGSIGSQVSILAEQMGMNVVFYDKNDLPPYGNAVSVPKIEKLLRISDIVTIHIPDIHENINLINEKRIKLLKKGAIFLNFSGYRIAHEQALKNAFKEGLIRGIGLDIHSSNLKKNTFESPFKGESNVFITPGISGKTKDSENIISDYLSDKILDFINTGNSQKSLNLPEIHPPPFPASHRLLHIHQNVYGILSQVNKILAESNINVISQHLKTRGGIGYLILDINKEYDNNVVKKLKKIPRTLKTRVLY